MTGDRVWTVDQILRQAAPQRLENEENNRVLPKQYTAGGFKLGRQLGRRDWLRRPCHEDPDLCQAIFLLIYFTSRLAAVLLMLGTGSNATATSRKAKNRPTPDAPCRRSNPRCAHAPSPLCDLGYVGRWCASCHCVSASGLAEDVHPIPLQKRQRSTQLRSCMD
jgi:hypothetical protein